MQIAAVLIDSSIGHWITMFDSAASLLRRIAGTLINACAEPGTTTNNVAEQGTNSNIMSVNCTQPWFGVENYIDAKLDEEEEKTLWGGGTPLYGLYRYVQPQRVWFFSCFGYK